MKRTDPVLRVAAVLMATPDERHHGYEVGKRSALRSGVLYPVLHRMLDAGWLADGWENFPDSGSRKRPARRYYELTELGRRELGAMPAPRIFDRKTRSVRPAEA